MNFTAIVQVRMGSYRLPRKSLADIAGKPLLAHVVDRVGVAKSVARIIVATTTDAEDDEIAAFAEKQEVACYRGSRDDVLDRFYRAAQSIPTDAIVRITADDPFKDPAVIDEFAGVFAAGGFDYVSNTIVPSYPEGLDVEVFSMNALGSAWREARLPSEREHVTPFIWKNPERFSLKNVVSETDNSGMRWTIDYPEDLKFARAVYERLYKGTVFGANEIYDLLRSEPDLACINAGVARNAGYLQSLETDRTST